MEADVARLEARVNRNESDIEKLIDSLRETREAATELTVNLNQLDEHIRNATKTLYGNGNRKNSLVSISDILVLDIEAIHTKLMEYNHLYKDTRKTADKAMELALKANDASRAALDATKNFNKLVEGNVIQIGKLKLSGRSANIAAVMIIPIAVVMLLLSILYFIMAFFHKVPWPW